MFGSVAGDLVDSQVHFEPRYRKVTTASEHCFGTMTGDSSKRIVNNVALVSN
jgi:hypothetical protein